MPKQPSLKEFEQLSLEEQRAALMRRAESDPGVAEVAEAMKRYSTPPYAVFASDEYAVYLAADANAQS